MPRISKVKVPNEPANGTDKVRKVKSRRGEAPKKFIKSRYREGVVRSFIG